MSAVIMRLRAVGQQAFDAALTSAATSVSGVGTAGQGTDAQTDRLAESGQRAARTFRQTMGRLATWTAGATAVSAGARLVRSSLDATQALAKSTMKLSRTTGMQTETASAWAEVAKTRNIDAAALNRGLVTLSKQMVAAAGGDRRAVAMFDSLGVPMDAVRAGDTNTVIMQTADALARMENPAQRAALAQRLFARSGQDLLPLLASGSAGVREQLDTARRYGAVVGGHTTEQVKRFAAQQRTLRLASDSLKISLGSALAPVLVQVTSLLAQVVRVGQPVLRNTTLINATMVVLATTFVALQVAAVQALIASVRQLGVWLPIIVAAVALVALLTLVSQRLGVISRASHAAAAVALAVVRFIQGHVGALVAAFAPWLAVAGLIFHRRDALLGAARAGFDHIRDVAHAWGDAFHTLSQLPGVVMRALRSLLPNMGSPMTGLGHAIAGYALGGVVPHTGVSVVGERGPELAHVPGSVALPAPALAAAPALDIEDVHAAWRGKRPVLVELHAGQQHIGTASAVA